jgi:phenylpyruvate tautomerase PptA (4-oxalocrotonate tautomerase family)
MTIVAANEQHTLPATKLSIGVNAVGRSSGEPGDFTLLALNVGGADVASFDNDGALYSGAVACAGAGGGYHALYELDLARVPAATTHLFVAATQYKTHNKLMNESVAVLGADAGVLLTYAAPEEHEDCTAELLVAVYRSGGGWAVSMPAAYLDDDSRASELADACKERAGALGSAAADAANAEKAAAAAAAAKAADKAAQQAKSKAAEKAKKEANKNASDEKAAADKIANAPAKKAREDEKLREKAAAAAKELDAARRRHGYCARSAKSGPAAPDHSKDHLPCNCAGCSARRVPASPFCAKHKGGSPAGAAALLVDAEASLADAEALYLKAAEKVARIDGLPAPTLPPAHVDPVSEEAQAADAVSRGALVDLSRSDAGAALAAARSLPADAVAADATAETSRDADSAPATDAAEAADGSAPSKAAPARAAAKAPVDAAASADKAMKVNVSLRINQSFTETSRDSFTLLGNGVIAAVAASLGLRPHDVVLEIMQDSYVYFGAVGGPGKTVASFAVTAVAGLLTAEWNERILAGLTAVVGTHCGVAPDDVMVRFAEVEPHMWCCNTLSQAAWKTRDQ